MPSSYFSAVPSGAGSLSSAALDQLGHVVNLIPGSLGAELARWLQDTGLSQEHRPVRLRIQRGQQSFGDALVAHSFQIDEELCTDISVRMRILCICTRADLPRKSLLGMPISVQVVTDTGKLRTLNATITTAKPGQSDGGAQVWMLEAEDALSAKRHGSNSRVFLRHSVLDIAQRLLQEWRQSDPVLAECFDFDVGLLNPQVYPVREMIIQWNESDAAFLIRLFRKYGIAWGVRPGGLDAGDTGSPDHGAPRHTLVLWDAEASLPRNEAGTVRYHHDGAAQERDAITLWSPVARLVPSSVERCSHDYVSQSMTEHAVPTLADMGVSGNEMARGLVDAAVYPPHWGDSQEDFRRLATLRMQRYEMEADYIDGASGLRDAACMTWIEVQGLPGAEAACSAEDRQFTFVQVTHHGQNNLPKDLDKRVVGMFAASGWAPARPVISTDDESRRYANTFRAVPRKVAIVPAFDLALHWPVMQTIQAQVVCPPDETVHCDQHARVKVRFLGLRVTDNEHAQGAGTSGTEADSAWVRLALGSAGAGRGFVHLPRAGDEAIMAFLMGDPDKPYIASLMHSPRNPPPAFHRVGGLPGNRYESGNFVSEIRGNGYVQTRFDATPGQLSYNVTASYTMASLNLGRLYAPRVDGSAQPRGEGAELTTQGAAVIRGQEGARVTTEEAHPTEGLLLARGQLIGLSQTMRAAAQQLGEMARAHNLSGVDTSKLDEWIETLQQWDHGTNVEPGEKRRRKPILSLDATASVGALSHDNLLLGAQTHVDTVAAGRIQSSAGQDILHVAGGSLEGYADAGDVNLTAGKGDVKLMAHGGGLALGANKRLHQYSLDGVLIEAPTIVLKTAGAQIALTDGGITLSTSGQLQGKAAAFSFDPGGGGGINLPGMPTSSMQTDERCRVTYPGTDEPRPGLRYTAFSKVDGRELGSGTTDEQGFTQAFHGIHIDAVQVIVHPEEDEGSQA